MLFNSLQYAIFLPIVFFLYWFVFDYALRRCQRQLLWQNLFVVIVSYVFYGWWDWRFLVLIAFTSLCSWTSGQLICRYRDKARAVMIANVVVNLAILGLFKYFNFFVTSFCSLFGLQSESMLIRVILPVGISFYTFQALSYSIDVYRGKIIPEIPKACANEENESAQKDGMSSNSKRGIEAHFSSLISFMAYVSFFPQLVAGPIERATNLLPQFHRKRTFDSTLAVEGMRQILWGLFKKMVVADNCATYVDAIWSDYANADAVTLAVAAILFSFQIYGDFSGYSDIAIGSAKLFGIRLRDNFRVPYFSRSVAEFWKRWHISLNTWFVDYVYIPLGGSRSTQWITIRNTFVIFLLSGLWHGANWTYVIWGLYHACLFIPLILMKRTKAYQNVAKLSQLPQILLTFLLASIGWIIFRAPSIADAWQFLAVMFTGNWHCTFACFSLREILFVFAFVAFMLLVEWFTRHQEVKVPQFRQWYLNYAFYAFLIIFTYQMMSRQSGDFIYFQF